MCLTAFLILTAVVVQHRLDGVDHIVRNSLPRSSRGVLYDSMEAASFLGGQPGQIVVVSAATFLLWQRRRVALALPIIMAGAGILQLAAKWAVDRPRPNLDPWGFPSAHVLSLVVLCGYFAYLIATSKAPRGWRASGIAVCVAIVCTVAFSRMYLDAHWFSDVLGGFTMGSAYLLAVLWLLSLVPAAVEAAVTSATAVPPPIGPGRDPLGEPAAIAVSAT